MEIGEFVVRAMAAIFFGLLLGIDREIKNAPVGVRTFALVSLGSAVYTMLTLELGAIAAERTDLSVDPSRLIQGLIGGIGFLGAGAIIGGSAEKTVRGIATGAAIWVAGGVGVACGLGMYWQAGAVTVLVAVLLIASELLLHLMGEREKIVQNRDDESD